MLIADPYIPESYIEILQQLPAELEVELVEGFRIRIANPFSETARIQKKRYKSLADLDKLENKLYKYCIFCGSPLGNSKEPYYYNDNIKIFEIRACCCCFQEYKDKSMEDLPETIRESVQNKLDAFLQQFKY